MNLPVAIPSGPQALPGGHNALNNNDGEARSLLDQADLGKSSICLWLHLQCPSVIVNLLTLSELSVTITQSHGSAQFRFSLCSEGAPARPTASRAGRARWDTGQRPSGAVLQLQLRLLQLDNSRG